MSPLLQSPLTIEHALLGFLRQSPMHGYEIHQRMSDANGLGTVWRVKQSRLYALLTRLEKEGLIRATVEPQGVHPPRKVFQLTAAGEQAFLDWVQRGVAHGRDIRLDFLVKFYFAKMEGVDAARHLVEQQQQICQNWLTRQQAAAAALNDERPFAQLVNQFRIGQIEAMLLWLDSCEQTLRVVDPAA